MFSASLMGVQESVSYVLFIAQQVHLSFFVQILALRRYFIRRWVGGALICGDI
jgi:hypothetical protein